MAPLITPRFSSNKSSRTGDVSNKDVHRANKTPWLDYGYYWLAQQRDD